MPCPAPRLAHTRPTPGRRGQLASTGQGSHDRRKPPPRCLSLWMDARWTYPQSPPETAATGRRKGRGLIAAPCTPLGFS